MKKIWNYLKALFIMWTGVIIIALDCYAYYYIIGAEFTKTFPWLPIPIFLTILFWGIWVFTKGVKLYLPLFGVDLMGDIRENDDKQSLR